jgi:shikimate dehydrogenase
VSPAVLLIGGSPTTEFARWTFDGFCRVLGKDARLRGGELADPASPEECRRSVGEVRDAADVAGALVASGGSSIFRHCRPMFEEVGTEALGLEEIDLVRRRGDGLLGDATETEVLVAVLSRLVSDRYWDDPSRSAVVLGGSTAGISLARWLTRPDRPGPSRVTVVERDPERRARVRRLLGRAAVREGSLELLEFDERFADPIVSAAGHGSLIVRTPGPASGPGPPAVSSEVIFPAESVVWELEFHGERSFLRAAREQALARRLVVEDGWRYFVFAWMIALARILHQRSPTAAELDAALAGAAPHRPY